VVKRPAATAPVQGTVFEFDGLRLKADEGRVHITGTDGGGTDIGAGQSARVNAETGRAAGAGERAREELAPPLPAGMDTAGVPASSVPAGNVNIGARVVWN
jgi:hypothetical protein